MKIVVNKCFGGFSISRQCVELMEKMGSKQAKGEMDEWRKRKKWLDYFKKNGKWPKDCPKEQIKWLEIDVKYSGEPKFFGYGYDKGGIGYSRTDPILIKAVEKLGEKANGELSKLEIIEIPDGVEWEIDDYDGMETIHEKHRSW